MSYQNYIYLYHLTAIDNLSSILQLGILSRSKAPICKDIADKNIVDKRKDLEVYVPFHFYPKTPFARSYIKKHYDTGFVYITVLRSYAREHNWLIAPTHPLSDSFTGLYQFDKGIKEIDWGAMTMTYDPQESYCHNVRMAECLSPLAVPISAIQNIYVQGHVNSKYRKEVELLLKAHNINKIKVLSDHRTI
ncbi:DUF4433 domain-containing protein [Photobacterium phosphoreum]|uniref:DarT ssDNA thymidine ADP-ribosyltransferase family protein n=1 Tax=Photobacterium phosphoreum TaxID=659 RepID=UPI000D17498A|nr:DarT ssDNA thymidine ADP-ribosyltransferase family protein [Photobacterium phosphoreum]PSU70744.1 DUF4433 domain-containing protein [Photobacterium phosphoreum]